MTGSAAFAVLAVALAWGVPPAAAEEGDAPDGPTLDGTTVHQDYWLNETAERDALGDTLRRALEREREALELRIEERRDDRARDRAERKAERRAERAERKRRYAEEEAQNR